MLRKCKLMTDEICYLSLSGGCRLQEIFPFILSYYFAKERSCKNEAISEGVGVVFRGVFSDQRLIFLQTRN